MSRIRVIGTLIAVFAILVTAAQCAVCEDYKYEPLGKRDPFVPLIGGSKPIVAKLEDITSVDDIKVEGIAIGAQGKRVAILNGEVLKENDKVGEVEIKKVDKKSVVIQMGGKSYNLYLPGEEGGIKSEE
jgi:type II secretory pathway component PulC